MNEFSEKQLDSLTPGDQVYEIGFGDDLAFRVLPNGSKTWVFTFAVEGVVRRHTLGVYPETGIAQAREALHAAREAAGRAAVVPEGNERMTAGAPERTPVSGGKSWLLGRTGMAITIAVLTTGGLLTLQANEYLTTVSRFEEQGLAPVGQGATPDVPEKSLPAGRQGTGETIDSRSTGFTARGKTPVSVSAPVPAAPGIHSGSAGEVVSANRAAAKTAGSSETPTASPPMELSGEAASVHSDEMGGRVKRAQFTTGIVDREPVDRIGPLWVGWNEEQDAQQIYFFTELGGMDGRTVYHRWELNGEQIGAVPFEIKSSWRWRVFSSKTVTPGATGPWRVTLVDDEGQVLHTQDLGLTGKLSIVSGE